MKTYKLKWYGETYNLKLMRSTYRKTNGLYVCLVTENGKDFADLTVCLDSSLEDNTHAYIDTNNLGSDILKWLEDNKIATNTGLLGMSGFCTYPLYEFDLSNIECY